MAVRFLYYFVVVSRVSGYGGETVDGRMSWGGFFRMPAGGLPWKVEVQLDPADLDVSTTPTNSDVASDICCTYLLTQMSLVTSTIRTC